MSRTYYFFDDKKFPILVSENACNITPLTFQSNGKLWENKSLFQFYKNIPKNEKVTIIDVGAQSGLYSLYSKYLKNATFYSFEPFPETFSLLEENLSLNNINNVFSFNIGLSNIAGKMILNTSTGHFGYHTLGNKPLRFTDIKPIKIQVDTVDNLFYAKNIPVDFIKIDTEGWEYYILLGAEKTINKYRPVIQLEWNIMNMKQCNVKKKKLQKLLKKYGYFEKEMVEEEKLFFPISSKTKKVS